jgi:hypothetical protein
MSSTATNLAHPRPDAPAGAARAEGPLAIGRPLLWLAAILVLALVVRFWKISAPLQQDEFGTLYAVAERQGLPPGVMPTEEYPLRPVAGWGEVRARSVLPYGITNPLPLYHWLLYAVVQVLPIAEWSLRLPSVLAGLGCVAGVYFLCRRMLGAEVALVAALFAAVDPMQVEVSVLARPYAIGNLACVLSFAGLLAILYGRGTAGRTGGAALYGLSMAVVGYMNPVLLLAVTAHLGMVAYWWLGRPREEQALASAPPGAAPPANPDEWAFAKAPRRSAGQLLFWLGGGLLAAVLLLPELGYYQDVRQFSRAHHEYLFDMEPRVLLHFLYHNSTFLVALLAVSLATLAMRQLSGGTAAAQEEGASEAANQPAAAAAQGVTASADRITTSAGPLPDAAATAPGKPEAEPPPLPPQPENPDLLWLGRCWLFLPQVLFMVLGYFVQINSSRYFTYVTLGGVILLAYWATRERARDVRLGVVCVVALAMFLWGFTDWSMGAGLITHAEGQYFVEFLNNREEKGRWLKGDLVLYRSGFLEADFLPDEIPEENRAHVEAVAASPITTLYTSTSPRSYVLLSLSQRRNDEIRTKLGKYYDPSKYYTKDLAEKIGAHSRYWLLTGVWNRRNYLAAVIPWLANSQHSDLLVARTRPQPEHYFLVAGDSQPEDYIAGLSDARGDDFTEFVLVQRFPGGGFSLGVVGMALTPDSHVTIPTWLATQCPTPRLTRPPADESPAPGSNPPPGGGDGK